MDPKVNYFIVGLFVVILSVSAVLFSLWMIFGFNQQSYREYLIYVSESVSGLNVEAPVKFNGVSVGTVKSIYLTPHNPQQVTVDISVQTGTPITVDTRATMMSQGITGLTFINLKGGSATSPLLKAKPGQTYPVIQSAPSLLVRVDTTLNNLTASLTRLDEGLSRILSVKNQENITTIIQSLAVMTHGLASHQTEINASLATLPLLLQNLNDASVSAVQAFNDMNGQLSQNLLPSLNNLSSELQADPAMLLRGRQNQAFGPGEY